MSGNNSEFHSYQQKQVNSPHLGPLCVISSVGMFEKRQTQLEIVCLVCRRQPTTPAGSRLAGLTVDKGLFVRAHSCV